MPHNIAIIPARKGSKGLRHKNILPLYGKPLILWTIETAIGSKLFDNIIVTTDDGEISKLVERMGNRYVSIVKRPPALAKDNTPLTPVVINALKVVEKTNGRYENIFTLQPTSPLRTSTHIWEAYLTYMATKADSLVSVVEEAHTIFTKETEDRYASMLICHTKNRQYIRPVYTANGAIFITKRETLLKHKYRLGNKIAMYEMDSISSLDIHTKEDMELAEWYLSRRK